LQPPLRPSAPIAADVLLIGDPARAMQVAQELIEGPKMSNHAHGLWGYGGRTADGRDLTIQSVGIGGPSAALVLSQLAGLGVRRAVLLGTCRAISSRRSATSSPSARRSAPTE
jgi:uridine phosphorylase